MKNSKTTIGTIPENIIVQCHLEEHRGKEVVLFTDRIQHIEKYKSEFFQMNIHVLS